METAMLNGTSIFFKTTSMLTNAAGPVGVFVPSFGWALFGGWYNPSTKVQVLSGVDGAWTDVANLYSQALGKCLLQVIKYLG